MEKVQLAGNISTNNMIAFSDDDYRVGVEIRRPSTLLSVAKDILYQELY